MSGANVGKVYNLTGGGGGGSSLKLEGIEVTSPPVKTAYKSGESFDPTGLVVTASYSYGITAEVTGYTVSPTVLTDGVTEVTVIYAEKRTVRTARIPVTVEKVLVSIAVTAPPDKTVYRYLESFDRTGMVVTASFTDGSTAPAEGYSCPAVEFSALGQQTVSLEYTYEGVTKTAILEVNVVPIEVAVPAQKGTVVYDGTAQTPSWEGYDALKMAVEGELSGTDAGSYTAIFTLVYGYVFPGEESTAQVSWEIGRAVIAAVPVQIEVPAADGTPKRPAWEGYDPDKLTIGGERVGSDAGEYTATFTPTANYQWWDGSTGAKDAVWTIASVVVSIPTQKGTLTYTGAAQTPEWANFDSEKCSVDVTAETDAGEYTAVFTLRLGLWEDGSAEPKTVSWSILRANAGAVPSVSGSLTYTGEEQSPAWNGYDSARMDLSGAASGVDAGSYTAVFAPKDNYCWSDGSITAKSVSWTIGRASIAVPTQNGSLTYNGVEQAPSLSNYDADKMVLSGEVKGVNAGDYSITATPGANYQWSDGTTAAKTVKWSIGKAAGSLTLSASSVTLGSSHLTAAVTVTRPGDGVITAISSDASVATVSVSGTMVTVSHVNQTTGTASITVKVDAGTNYTAPADKTIAVTAQFVPALNECTWAQISEISAKSQGANCWNVGDRKAVAIKGTVGTLAVDTTLYVYILGFDHNSTIEGKGIQFGTFKSALSGGTDVCLVDRKYNSLGGNTGSKNFAMNHWGSTSSPYNTNYGGWKGCDARYDILGSTNKAPSGYGSMPTTSRVGYDAETTTATNPVANTLMAALPADLRAVMKPITKYTDNKGNSSDVAANVTASVDYLPLLSEYEISGGSRVCSNQYEKDCQAQYAYYSAGNSKVKYRHDNNDTAAYWWGRSPAYTGDTRFCDVTAKGAASGYTSNYSFGLAPAFMV